MASDAGAPQPAAVGDLIDLHQTPNVAASPISPTSPAQRQGEAQQQMQRAAEHQARRHAAQTGQHLFDLGWLWRDVADLFHVAGRTLRQWCHDLWLSFWPSSALGRPRQRSSRDARNEVIDFLDEFGPGLGVPTLRGCFPTMSRAELDELLKCYRRVWRQRHRVPLRVLHWPVAGRVWAIDYAMPPQPIDGVFDSLLAVRDLATGMQLLWQPAEAATGNIAAGALATLFAHHGPPLVLKSDNGSHFADNAVQDLLRTHQVECLFSPPHWPRYNGAIEAGIGTLKERTESRAARAGHPGRWTWDDTSGARLEANTLSKPHGINGPSPEQAWQHRMPILTQERDAFAACVHAHLADEKRRPSPCELSSNGVWSDREMARKAIRLTLEERGYLHYTRRRILPPIPAAKTARIP